MRPSSALFVVAVGLSGSMASAAPPEDFGAAATACFEATQSAKVDEALIEQRGWVREERAPGFLEGASSGFRRPGTNVSIAVADQQRQCLVIWVSPSENGADKATGSVVRAINATLDGRYGNRASASEPLTRGQTTRVRYNAENSVGVLRTDVRGSLVQLYFVAMNKDVAAAAQTAAN